MATNSDNRPFLVIIGPSGVGKTSVVRTLQRKGLVQLVPSWTTRPPRDDEKDEVVSDHVFVSNEEFDAKVEEGFFLEQAALFGLSYRYGLPRINEMAIDPAVIPVVLLNAPLLPLVKKYYDNFIVYQIEDSEERVAKRLARREQTGELPGDRMKHFIEEVAAGRRYASRTFINQNTITSVADEIEASIRTDF